MKSILYQEDLYYLIETLHLRNIYINLNDDVIQKKILDELDDFVYPNLDIQFDKHKIFNFCSELKKFYVIITRAKTFLVFYESNLNQGRDSFYEFMKSENIKLIDSENILYNQNQLLQRVSNYFNDINLRVKSPTELRILGNNEFNEGHYSRAVYLYNLGRHYLLSSISEVFYNEQIISERIDLNDKSPELDSLNNKIIVNTTKILENHENNDLHKIIELDHNRININNVLNQFITFRGKSFIYFEKYDEAIELYKKHKMKYEIGMIYYQYKKEYQLAFDYFDSILNYKFALKSLMKMKNIQNILDYSNKIAFYLGIIDYNEIYKRYVNSYFSNYFIERKKINVDLNLEQLKKEKDNELTKKQIISNFFWIYINQINNLQMIDKKNNINNIEEIQSLQYINYIS